MDDDSATPAVQAFRFTFTKVERYSCVVDAVDEQAALARAQAAGADPQWTFTVEPCADATAPRMTMQRIELA